MSTDPTNHDDTKNEEGEYQSSAPLQADTRIRSSIKRITRLRSKICWCNRKEAKVKAATASNRAPRKACNLTEKPLTTLSERLRKIVKAFCRTTASRVGFARENLPRGLAVLLMSCSTKHGLYEGFTSSKDATLIGQPIVVLKAKLCVESQVVFLAHINHDQYYIPVAAHPIVNATLTQRYYQNLHPVCDRDRLLSLNAYKLALR